MSQLAQIAQHEGARGRETGSPMLVGQLEELKVLETVAANVEATVTNCSPNLLFSVVVKEIQPWYDDTKRGKQTLGKLFVPVLRFGGAVELANSAMSRSLW